ncbi:hypothetical protein ON010_g6916 [Phytophthora cinnamomi]|nr:hypothetical protein ON010_g6916 [Phytophthora cinnamomi]
MNLTAFVLATLVSLAAVQTQVTYINYDQVEPFPRRRPKNTTERAAVKYKSQIHVSFGCHPYPAAQANGFVSAGLKGSRFSDGDCKGPSLGLQVFQRRHFWEVAVGWIDDPALKNSTMLGVSLNYNMRLKTQTPKYLDGNSLMLDSFLGLSFPRPKLCFSEKKGEFQDMLPNCDETGIDPQGGVPVKVIAAHGARNVSIRRGSNRENTSVLMEVSGTGVLIPPLFIFKGKGRKAPFNLLHGAPGGVTLSPNAFVDTVIFSDWIDHFAKHIPPRRPVLLVLDNHRSHIALGVRQKCLNNGIHLLSLPPHCTHVMQPLDAGSFRTFKAEWREVVKNWSNKTKAKNIPRPLRARMIGEAMLMAFTPDNIQASWRSTVIWPPNPKAIDRSIVSKDTRPTSRYAKYEVVEDPHPIHNIEGRAVRGLVRDGLSLQGLRSYSLTVNEVAIPLTWEEKETLARKTMIDLGPRRLLTHEDCMEAEVEHFRRKKEAAELIMMKAEDAASKKIRAAFRIEERKQALAAKRRDATDVKAAADAEKARRQQDRRTKGSRLQGKLKLKCRKGPSSEAKKVCTKRQRLNTEDTTSSAPGQNAYKL